MKYFLRFCPLFWIMFMGAACSPTRRVPQGEYLLNSVRVNINEAVVPVSDIREQLTQQPNERILGTRFHLWLYNISNPAKQSRFREGLRKAGEAPVIWRQSETEKSKQQIRSLLMTKGYFYSQVKDTVVLRGKKAVLSYDVDPGFPYRVNRVIYQIKDPLLREPVLADTANSLLKSGVLIDQQLFAGERDRIEYHLRQSGYYAFSSDYIHYRVDTFYRHQHADIFLVIENVSAQDSAGHPLDLPHPKYTLRDVSVDIQSAAIQDFTGMEPEPDTVRISGISFALPAKSIVKPLTVSQFIHLHPGQIYNVSQEENTYRSLSQLKTYKLVNIRFEEEFRRDTLLRNRLLDARISLSPFRRHSLSTDFQATYANGDPGGAVALNYQNLSLFRSAEIFNIRTRLAMESLKARGQGMFPNTKEYGLEASLNLPKFVFFRKNNGAMLHAHPRTTFTAGYNYLQRPEYRRTVASLSLGYSWSSRPGIIHSLRPIDFYYVNSEISDTYRALIRGMFIESSYIPHTILGASYGLTFSNQQVVPAKRLTYWSHFGIESAGALLSAGSSLLNVSKNETGYRELLGRPYSQYLRADFDFRLYHGLGGFSGLSKMAYRFYAGVGIPYGNSDMMPFEKRFYAGGAYGIRGWRIYSLGPGSYRNPETSYSSTGDIRLEFNVENRFKLFWILEGALFVDGGNVWDAKKDPARPGADFAWNRFMREMAVSAGAGLRFDFSFVVGRFDVGVKMRDPVDGFLWSRGVRMEDVTFNFGIGYPF